MKKNVEQLENSQNTDLLESYFSLFDESRVSKEARAKLISIFTEDMSFVLSGHKKDGIGEWENFLDLIFQNNLDIKHMYEGWKFDEESQQYVTRWAVCGKKSDGTVYVQVGKDIAKLDENGKIKYLENVPDDTSLFRSYQ